MSRRRCRIDSYSDPGSTPGISTIKDHKRFRTSACGFFCYSVFMTSRACLLSISLFVSIAGESDNSLSSEYPRHTTKVLWHPCNIEITLPAPIDSTVPVMINVPLATNNRQRQQSTPNREQRVLQPNRLIAIKYIR